MKKITSKIAMLALVLVFIFGYGAHAAFAQSVTATSITCNSVVLQGDVSINPSGTPTNVWFQWGRSSVLENNSNRQTATYSSVFSQPVYNLSPSTTYYYRAMAQNAPFGTVYGAIYNFTTPSCGNPNSVTYVAPVTPPVKTETVVINKVVETKQSSLINLSIVSDNERVCSGEDTGFTVEYTNVSNQTLKGVALRVMIPGEFNFKGSSSGVFSDKDNALTIDIGTLFPGEKGRVSVRVSASRSYPENETLVTTANLVYTTTGGVQEQSVAYSLSKLGCYSQNGALAFFSGNFFPTTLLGWLILILIIIALVILSRRTYGSYAALPPKK